MTEGLADEAICKVETIGQRIAAARHLRAQTLSQLSARSGLSTGYLSKLERDTANPTLETMSALAQALDTTLAYLIGVPDELECPATPENALGARVAWARSELGLTLRHLCTACQLTEGYLSQLEGGARCNPTLRVLQAMERGLAVTLPYLLGYVPRPTTAFPCLPKSTTIIANKFDTHLRSLPPQTARQLQLGSVAKRVACLVSFLYNSYPTYWTPVTLAYRLGQSVRSLREICNDEVDPGVLFLDSLSAIAGVPFSYFGFGDTAPRPEVPPAPELCRLIAASDGTRA